MLVEGTLYAVSGDNFAVYALDAETGAKRWSVERDFPSFLSLLGVTGGRAFVATSDDELSSRGETLIALDAETGEEAWTAETGDASGAAVTADAVYVASWGRLDAFDAADGTRRWTRAFEGRPLDPAAGDDAVYTGFNAGRRTAALGLESDSGETRWTMDEWFVTSLVADESAYVGGEHVAEFASDGTERWRYEVDAEFGAVEGADEEVVAVQRENGPILDVLGAETGERRFTFDVGESGLFGVAVDSGTVYAGNGEGAVYALRE